MKRILPLIVLIFTPLVGLAVSSLEYARQAQAMLGVETWSRLVRIENASACSAFPAVVDALVFETGELLWFYTSTNGTQSLSLHRHRLAEEKADLAPLLREIHPGFTRFEFLADETAKPAPGPLPNGCFVECLAALRACVLRGEQVARPRLLSCYASTLRGMRGHTVLTYETPRGFFLVDPAVSPHPRQLPRKWTDKADTLAGIALQGAKVLRARWVPVENPTGPLLAREHPATAPQLG